MTKIESLLKEYLDYLEIEKNRSPKTRENYERYLRSFIKSENIKKPEDITVESVKTFRVKLARCPVRGRSQFLFTITTIIIIKRFHKYQSEKIKSLGRPWPLMGLVILPYIIIYYPHRQFAAGR